MVVLISTFTISCSQALGIINRLQQVVGLTSQQKAEIVVEVRKVIPICPVKILENKK